jgi:hypothetical protein
VSAKKPAKRKAQPKKRGRPSLYTKPLGNKICARLETGEPLAVICRDAGMPHDNTVRRWAEAHPGFAVDIARAREKGFDAIALQCLEIANTPQEGVTEKLELVTVGKDSDGAPIRELKVVERTREDMLGHRKLQIETRLKLLAKWDPKRYGELQKVEHSGTMTLEQLVAASMAKPSE